MWTFHPHDILLVACVPSLLFVVYAFVRAYWPERRSGVAVPSASELGTRLPRPGWADVRPRGTAAPPQLPNLSELNPEEAAEIEWLVDALLRSEGRPLQQAYLAGLKSASKWVM